MKGTLCKYSVLFCLFGCIYYCIEILFRGYSHWTMFLLAGLCCVLIGMLNEFTDRETCVWIQMFWAALLVTFFEFLFGLVFNISLGWHIWDYSQTPFNLLGQICLPFSVAWFFLSLPAILLDDWVRTRFFGEDPHHYVWRLEISRNAKEVFPSRLRNFFKNVRATASALRQMFF